VIAKSFMPSGETVKATKLTRPQRDAIWDALERSRKLRGEGIAKPVGEPTKRPASGPFPKVGNPRRYQRQVGREEWYAGQSARRKAAREAANAPRPSKQEFGHNGYRWQPTRQQYRHMAIYGTLGAGAAGATEVSARKVSKADRKDLTPEVAGGVAGYGAGRLAWEGGGWATKRSIDRYQKKAWKKAESQPPRKQPTVLARDASGKPTSWLGAKTRAQEIDSSMQAFYRGYSPSGKKPTSQDFRDWNKQHGKIKGHYIRQRLFENYPRDVPGGTARRLLAYKNRPEVATAFGVATVAGGAAAAHRRREKVGKGVAQEILNEVATIGPKAAFESAVLLPTGAIGLGRQIAQHGKNYATAQRNVRRARKARKAIGATGNQVRRLKQA
jgi:hypothetical protein